MILPYLNPYSAPGTPITPIYIPSDFPSSTEIKEATEITCKTSSQEDIPSKF